MDQEVTPRQPEASTDPLERLVAILSELPTESAMKELNKGRINGSVRQVIETMALHKNDIIGSMALLAKRDHIATMMLKHHYNFEGATRILDIDWSTLEISYNERKKD